MSLVGFNPTPSISLGDTERVLELHNENVRNRRLPNRSNNEIDISSWIESIYCSLYNPASLRNSMKDEVDKLVSVNSIEKLLYKFSRSIFTV